MYGAHNFFPWNVLFSLSRRVGVVVGGVPFVFVIFVIFVVVGGTLFGW